MADMTDIDAILPAGGVKARRRLPRRAGPAKNTEALGASLESAVDKLGFPDDAGITAASLELGLMFKRARLAKGLTQAQLARRIGQSQTALSMIENGRGPDGPTWATVARICEALDIEPAFLPLSARPPGGEEGKVRIVKASTGAKALVREASLDEAAAKVALDLISDKATRWLKTVLREAAFGAIRPKAEKAGSRFWSLAPHTGTRIKADGPLVIITLDESRVDVRAVGIRGGAGKTFVNHGVALLGKAGAVEVSNTSSESSVVFAVPAEQLPENGEAAV